MEGKVSAAIIGGIFGVLAVQIGELGPLIREKLDICLPEGPSTILVDQASLFECEKYMIAVQPYGQGQRVLHAKFSVLGADIDENEKPKRIQADFSPEFHDGGKTFKLHFLGFSRNSNNEIVAVRVRLKEQNSRPAAQ